jgi:biopolymer transport protein ExbD
VEFHRRRRIEANIDMTPMIDTLLQIFVAFLLSMTFLSSSVRLTLPQAAASQKEPMRPIVLTVDATNQLYLNNEKVSPAELPLRLPPLLAKAAKPEVDLVADQSLPYKHVLRTLLAVRQAGANDVHLKYEEERKP